MPEYSKAEQVRRGTGRKGGARANGATAVAAESPPEVAENDALRMILLAEIEHGRNPRTIIELPRQKELIDSVKQHGVLQPVLVVRKSDGRFSLIAGHRRYEAAKSARLKEIPAYVKDVGEHDRLVTSMVENLQRSDLNAIDEAKAYRQLLEDTGLSQEDLGKRLGRSQSHLSNMMKLLDLPESVREKLENQQLTAAHAKAIATLAPERQVKIADAIVEGKVSSKAAEEMVREEKSLQVRAEQAKATQEAQVTKAVAAGEKLVAENADATPPVTKESLRILAVQGHVVVALQEAGFKRAEAFEWNGATVHARPEYKCSCQDDTVLYDDWRGFEPVCVEDAHLTAHRKEKQKKRESQTKSASKNVEKARGEVLRAVRSEDGEALSDLGLRLSLYMVVTSSRGGYGSTAIVDRGAFVKRHGGKEASGYSSDRADVFEAVMSMTPKDVVNELAEAFARQLVVNVWLENPPYGVEVDRAVRQHLADKKVIAKDAVYGKGGVPKNVLEADARRREEELPKPKGTFVDPEPAEVVEGDVTDEEYLKSALEAGDEPQEVDETADERL